MPVPFKILYSNDLTNILACVTPFHKRGEDFRAEMLAASVDEVAGTGVDVHLLQPGFGWVPTWQSKILPPAKQWEWLKKTYQLDRPDSWFAYLLAGGDIVADFCRRCRETKQSPFLSLRMNDTHHLDRIDLPGAKDAFINFCEFYRSHPEYRLETAGNSWRDRGQNWAIPEVREYKFNFLRELCENYDFDGLELDFMRAPYLFRSYETTFAGRSAILTGFVEKVRKMMDANGKRHLCIRIPAERRLWNGLGIDIAKLADAGVDMFNLSYNYYTVVPAEEELRQIRALVPAKAMYLEMTSCASIGRAVEIADGDNFEFTKTEPEHFYTAAKSAYAAGMDGVSLFNFVYYREHGSPNRRKKASEPPFEIIRNFGDRAFLDRQPSCCFIGSHWEDDGPLPKSMMMQGQYAKFSFPGVCAATGDAGLAVHIDNPRAGDWEAWFNDRPVFLKERSETLLTWRIPAEYLRADENRLEFRSKDLDPSVIDFLELKIGEKK